MKTYDIETLTQQWSPVSDLLSPLISEQDYGNARSLLDQLIDVVGDNENHPLATLMYHLGNLIDDFEANDEELKTLGEKRDAVSTLKFLMDQNGLKQTDLANIFGSQGNVSEVLRGKRELNIKHIRQLASRFNVNASTFVD